MKYKEYKAKGDWYKNYPVIKVFLLMIGLYIIHIHFFTWFDATHLSRVMAVMERVDTNTETEASSGMVLQRADTGYQVQKLQGKALISLLEYWKPSFILPVLYLCESNGHGDQTLPQVRHSKVHNQKISTNYDTEWQDQFFKIVPCISEIWSKYDCSNNQKVSKSST